ncbi:MAG TPA: hypothetical protein VK543_06710 [Puia sp.]|nr:hypothetical protein [Puia sp.]
MYKFFAVAFVLLITTAAFAQKDSTVTHKPPVKKEKKDWSKVLLGNRSNDHLVIQLGYDNWVGAPDSIKITGIGRSFNWYFMFDFPFKTDPRFSVAAGLGVGWSNIYFDKQQVLVASLNPTLAFPDNAGSNHFKKYKLVTANLQLPIELRFALDPENTNQSWKFAVGIKVGTMLSGYTKAKNLLNSAGQPINNYIEKEVSKKYFNTTSLIGTFRISYGVLGIFAQYQLSPLIKNGLGPTINPYSIGFQISGL